MTSRPKADCQVAVIGAGPYGLSAAAHLGAAGLATQVFGVEMEYWARHMPAGMLLRSAWEASHISDPHRALTLDRYAAERGAPVPMPVPLTDYLGYGRWFQSLVVPDLDRRRVSEVNGRDGGFDLVLEDGDTTSAERVVVATGLERFAWRPPAFADLPDHLASHVSDHDDLSSFADREVLVVGAGQSALESAALLAEAGASVELLCRAPAVRWLRGGPLRRRLGPLRPLLYPDTDVGPPGLNHIVARPSLLGGLPSTLRERAVRRAVRPAGAEWLRERLAAVTVTVETSVTHAGAGRGVHVRLSDGSARVPDHVLLATGYRVELDRAGVLGPELLEAVELDRGYPRLGRGLECSVRGLHFLGAAAGGSYGPLMRFVSGTRVASRALARQVVGEARRRPPWRAPRPVPPPATPLPAAPGETPRVPATTR